MHHVDLQVEQPDRFQHRAGKEREPLAIVDVVVPTLGVQLEAIEVLVLLDQVDWDIALRQSAAEQRPNHAFAADGNFQPQAGRFDRTAALSWPADRRA